MIIKSKKDLEKCSDLLFTIYHEAGHTISGLLNLIKIEYVYVYENKQNKRIEGLTHYNAPDVSLFKDINLLSNLLHSEICFRYAGLTAEKQYFKNISGSDKFPIFLRDGSSIDTLYAASLIRQYNIVPPGKKRYAYKKKIIKETANVLQNNWEAVTLIAHALFQKKSLDFFTIKNILIKKSQNKEFWKPQFKIIESIYDNNAHLDENYYKYILSI